MNRGYEQYDQSYERIPPACLALFHAGRLAYKPKG